MDVRNLARLLRHPRIAGQLKLVRRVNTIPHAVAEKHRKSVLAADQREPEEPSKPDAPRHFKYVYPDFLPHPNWYYRDRVAEKLERKDMWKRRAVIKIPEFYVGSIMAVTASDKYAPNKTNRFVGICIQRNHYGLRSSFILRNHVDGLGMEIEYDMYNPSLLTIEVLLLEKRLDDDIMYLRDCDPVHSTFPFDMDPVPHPPGAPVPLNTTKVQLNPRPWDRSWHLMKLKGAIYPEISPKAVAQARHPRNARPWEQHDLMHEYRRTINEEDFQEIFSEVQRAANQLAEDKKAPWQK